MLILSFLLETTIVEVPERGRQEDHSDAQNLADYRHPAVQELAHKLAADFHTDAEKLKHLFLYVRDSILFGFPPRAEGMKASEVLEAGIGNCIGKTTLFLALCKAAGLKARMHFAPIDTHILKGLAPWWAFPLLPATWTTAWLEVELAGRWRKIDAYINDKRFCEAAWSKLKQSGEAMGYSLSLKKPVSCDFCINEEGFHHMGAVLEEDFGVFADPADFLHTPQHKPLSKPALALYPFLASAINQRVKELRGSLNHPKKR